MADALEAASDAYRLVLENDRVRVLEYRAAPGVKAEMHSHPDIIAVALRGGKVRFTLHNGETANADLADGETQFFEATEHMTENMGMSELHVVIIELKEPVTDSRSTPLTQPSRSYVPPTAGVVV